MGFQRYYIKERGCPKHDALVLVTINRGITLDKIHSSVQKEYIFSHERYTLFRGKIYSFPNHSFLARVLSHFPPFSRLHFRHNIWQLSATVRPPSRHDVMWSASISLSSKCLPQMAHTPFCRSYTSRRMF